MTNEDKHCFCRECGKEISVGRADKKFCSGQCRSRFHNRSGSAAKVRYKVHAVLNRNYLILDGLIRMGKTSATHGELAALGYNHAFVTSCSKVRSHLEIACFDICYSRGESRIYNMRRVLPSRILNISPDSI